MKPTPYKKFVIKRKNEETEKTEYLLWVDENTFLWVTPEEKKLGIVTTFFEEKANGIIKKVGSGIKEVWVE